MLRRVLSHGSPVRLIIIFLLWLVVVPVFPVLSAQAYTGKGGMQEAGTSPATESIITQWPNTAPPIPAQVSPLNPAINLSDLSGFSGYQDVAVDDNNNIYVAWFDNAYGTNNVLFSSSLDGGQTFTFKILSRNAYGGGKPKMTADIGEVDIVWEQVLEVEVSPGFRVPQTDIYLAQSYDKGASFRTINISNNPGMSKDPQIAVSGPNVYVLWTDDTPGKSGLRLGASKDGGYTFTELPVSGTRTYPWERGIAASGTEGYVVWQELAEPEGIYFAKVGDGPALGPAIRLSSPPSSGPHFFRDSLPDIAVAYDGTIYVAWQEYISEGTEFTDQDVYYALSNDGGTTFSEAQNLSNSPDSHSVWRPRLAVGGDKVYLAWKEWVPSSQEGLLFLASAPHGSGFNTVTIPAAIPTYDSLLDDIVAEEDNVYVSWSRPEDVYLISSSDSGASFSAPINISQDGNAVDGEMAALRDRVVVTYFRQVGTEWWDTDLFARSVFSSVENDLALEKVSLLQAIDDAESLVDMKQTALQVVVENRFPNPVTTTVTVNYEDWTNGSPEGFTETEEVTLEHGTRKLYFGPFLPGGDSYMVSATVDQEGNVEEIDESNNSLSATLPVKDTKPLRIWYVPVKLLGDTAPTPQEMAQFAAGSTHFVLGTFPVSEKESTPYRVSPSPYQVPISIYSSGNLTEEKLDELFSSLDRMLWFSSYDTVVGVVRKDWFKDKTELTDAVGLAPHGSGLDASIIEGQYIDGIVAAHEIAHTLGWVSGSPPGDAGNSAHASNLTATGYWVVEEKQVKSIDFMNPSVALPGVGTRWVSKDTWDFLLGKLKVSGDPPVIGMSGVIFKDGQIVLDPWYRFDSAIDVPLDNPGEVKVIYLDGAGTALAQTGFDISFADYPEGGGGELDAASFSHRVPDVTGTAKIAIEWAGNRVERAISPNPPQVQVLSPNGGETFYTGDNITMTWQSSDIDGETLSHVVSLSEDGGTTWTPLDMDVAGNEFIFEVPPLLHTDSALVRVTASDGVNTAEDRSDAVFSIKLRVPEGLPISGEPVFGPITALSGQLVNAYPEMSVEGDNVYVAWAQAVQTPVASVEVLLRASADGGGTFGNAINVSRDPDFPQEYHYARDLSAVSSGGNAYVAWGEDGYWNPYDRVNQPIGKTKFRTASNGGASLGPVVDIGWAGWSTGGLVRSPEKPALAASGNHVYVAWINPSSISNGDIVMRASHDGGLTFGASVNLTNDRGRNYFPQLVADENRVYALWMSVAADNKYHVFLRVSPDSGDTFTAAVDLGIGSYPQSAAVANRVYVVYAGQPIPGSNAGDLILRVSNDFGTTFGAPVNLTPDTGKTNPNAAWYLIPFHLRADPDNVYVAWSDEPLNDSLQTLEADVYFRVSHDGGATFGPTHNLSNSPSEHEQLHRLAVSGRNVYVSVIEDAYGAANLSLRTSVDGGENFGAAVPLNDAGSTVGTYGIYENLYRVHLVAAGPRLYVVWAGGNRQIFFRAGAVPGGGAAGALGVDAGPDQAITEGQLFPLAAAFVNAGSLDNHTASIDWGDGTSGAGTVSESGGAGTVTGTHRYAENGAYQVRVTVRDAGSQESSDNIMLTVTNVAPGIAVTPGLRATAGIPFVLSGLTFGDPGWQDTYTASLDWGDGAVTPGSVTVTEAGGPGIPRQGTISGNHTYAGTGTYTVQVSITDDDGGTSNNNVTVVATANTPPVARAGGPYVADEGSIVFLDASGSSDPDLDNLSCEWQSGGQALSRTLALSLPVPLAMSDNFSVTATLIVTDSRGGTATDTASIVFNNVPPRVDAGPDQTINSPMASLLVSFSDPGGLDTHTAAINWGDGTVAPGTVNETGGSGTVSSDHTYAQNGNYTVMVTVTDDDGGTGSDALTINVSKTGPLPSPPPSPLPPAPAVEEPRPASFTISDVQITSGQPVLGGMVTITALVTNTGELTGIYELVLEIDGVVIETREVTIEGGSSKLVSFTFAAGGLGEHVIRVGDFSLVHNVQRPPSSTVSRPSEFVVSNLSITPGEVMTGEEVTVSVLVTNTGGTKGSYTVVFTIDGIEEDAKDISLGANESGTITFTITKGTEGTYEVSIAGEVGQFTVIKEVPVIEETPAIAPTEEQPGVPMVRWIIGGVIAGCVLVVGLLAYFVVRRRST